MEPLTLTIMAVIESLLLIGNSFFATTVVVVVEPLHTSSDLYYTRVEASSVA